VRSLAAGLFVLAAPGCFYFDTINQRPSIAIRQTSSDAVSRDAVLTLEGRYDDPDSGVGALEWQVYACTSVSVQDGTSCDSAAFYSRTTSKLLAGVDQVELRVPSLRASGAPVEALRVTLAARDDRGAVAKPTQELVIPVGNAAPTLELRKLSSHGYVPGVPIDVFAKLGDADDGPGKVTVQWKVFPPNTQPTYTLADLGVLAGTDPRHRTVGKTLTPHGTGDWTVRVTATDPVGATIERAVSISVDDDRPPCLAQWQPIIPAATDRLPIFAPTVFQIPLVADDLDVYPALPADPVLGAATFAWSILPPGAALHQVLAGATGNAIAFDPGRFSPGDLVELRVEAFDRAHPTTTCADSLATCPVVSQPACGARPTQRQTWRLEIR
jgi:hypothetical protein